MNIFTAVGTILGSLTATTVTSLEAVENGAQYLKNTTQYMLDEQDRDHDIAMKKLTKELDETS